MSAPPLFHVEHPAVERAPEVPLTYYCDVQRHLVCTPYSVPNLHRMAADLGLHRCWFHAGRLPHYDLPKRRIAEITARCTLVRPVEILRIIQGATR